MHCKKLEKNIRFIGNHAHTSQEHLLMFTSSFQTEKKSDFDPGIVVGARIVGLSISETGILQSLEFTKNSGQAGLSWLQ